MAPSAARLALAVWGSIMLGVAGLSPAIAQSDFGKWLEEREGAKIEPYLMLQVWSTYSHGQELYDGEAESYLPLENRINLQLRRGRFGVRIRPYEDLRFNLALAYDLLGRDVYTATIGGANNASRPVVSVWDAFLQWRMKPGSEAFHLVAGYFRPQLSRESITSAWQVSSFEKAMSQSYIRIHLTGIGPGRAPGVNLGGLLPGLGSERRFHYNVGLFTPVNQVLRPNSGGRSVSPLLVGRLAVFLGEPEMESYRIGYTINSFNERDGLSLAVGGAWQGANDLFDHSAAASVDLLFNRGPFHLDGEVNLMWRRGEVPSDGVALSAETHLSRTGHLRAGYNLRVGRKYFLEPAVMVYGFAGGTGREEQELAAALSAFSGDHWTYDVGLNWYLNRNRLRLMLHYTVSEGDAGAAGEGFLGNLHFTQNTLGAIRRGNWLGLGLNALF